jgi:hypothetical protein
MYYALLTLDDMEVRNRCRILSETLLSETISRYCTKYLIVRIMSFELGGQHPWSLSRPSVANS